MFKGFKMDRFSLQLAGLLLVMVGAIGGMVAFAAFALVDYQEQLQRTPDGTDPPLDIATPLLVEGPTERATDTATFPATVTIAPSSTATIMPESEAVAIAQDGTIGPTSTFTLAPPTQLPPTATATLIHTPTPTNTPTATYTPSRTPTPTTTPSPTTTPTLTLTPSSTPTPTITPTSPFTAIPYPDGRRMQLYFDANSFYIYNPTSTELRTENITLEGLTAQGQPTGKRFSGRLWAQFYAGLEPGKCVAIEITQSSPWLRPAACQDYNAIITPQRSARTTFWLNDDETVAFRVLWRDELIGACSLQRGICDIYFP